ncbi:hypothetical protein E2320_012546 [Naja naja]|nr:hypothetical protein E2320_012546 [Naja naja]
MTWMEAFGCHLRVQKLAGLLGSHRSDQNQSIKLLVGLLVIGNPEKLEILTVFLFVEFQMTAELQRADLCQTHTFIKYLSLHLTKGKKYKSNFALLLKIYAILSLSLSHTHTHTHTHTDGFPASHPMGENMNKKSAPLIQKTKSCKRLFTLYITDPPNPYWNPLAPLTNC